MAVRYDEQRKRWLVEFEQAHIRIFRRLPKGSTQTQAQSLETKLRREIFDRETLEKIPALSLEKAIEQWLLEDHRRKDRRKMQSEARQWEPFAKGRLLREVPQVVQEAMSEWSHTQSSSGQQSGRTAARGTSGSISTAVSTRTKAATINRRLAMLKSVCRHAYKQGRIAENLSGRITVLREDNKREVYLTKRQVSQLAAASSYPATIWLAAYTGLRASELLALPKMPPHSATLHVYKSKSGKPRIVPVAGPARRYLSALPLEHSYWQLHKDFSRARKAIGMPGLHFHDLRHTFASWLAAEGEDLYTIATLLGDQLQSAQRYTHLVKGRLRDAVGKLK